MTNIPNENEQGLEFTGERYVPGEAIGDIELEHLHRYLLARELVAGKTVLDIACGEGYGSFMLAQAAARVIGVDISQRAVAHAQAKYSSDNLEYLLGSCADIPLREASVDVVVSFETIEHHADHDAMMAEIKRVLRPDGYLIISCPDKYEYSDKPNYRNEFHVKELYRDEFRLLLQGSFNNHCLYGQRVVYGSLVLSEDGVGDIGSYAVSDNELAAISGTPHAVYLIAVASNAEPPRLKSGIFQRPLDDSEMVKGLGSHIERLEGAVDNLNANIRALVIDRDSQQSAVLQLQAAFHHLSCEHEDKVAQLNHLVAERDGQIFNLAQTVESLVIDRDSQKAGLAQMQVVFTQLSQQRDEQVAQLNHLVAARDGQIFNLAKTAESLVIDRDSQKAGLAQLQVAFTQLSQQRDEQVAQLNHLVAERDGQIFNLAQTAESLVIDRDFQKAGLAQLQVAFTQLSQRRDEQVAQLNHLIAARDDRIKNIDMELSSLYKSKSWRLTAPLRKLVRLGAKITAFLFHGSGQNAQLPVATSRPGPELPFSASDSASAAPKEHSFRILLVSYYCPTRAHAGGLRILDIYALIRQHCPDIQLDLFTHHRPSIDWSLDEAYRIFDNVYLSPVEDLTAETLADLRGAPLTYDVVDLQFHQSGYHISEFRKIARKLLFTPMESATKVLFLDLRAKFQIRNFLPLRKLAASIRTAAEELVFTQKVDEVVCVSRTDAAFLRMLTSSRRIHGIDTGVSQFEFSEALAPDYVVAGAASKPVSVLYVAYFGSETNVLALLWYLEHVHPLVKARVPDYVLKVVGRGDLSPFIKYCDKSIELVGEVPAISPYIKEARVSIAPALGGSGFRGKVNQYAVLGCPCVVSPIALKGLSYQDGENIFVAEAPEIFADRCIQLLTNLELNDRMGKAARQMCMNRYSWQSRWDAIRKIYKLDEAK